MNLSRQPVLDCQRASRLTGNRVIPARARPPGAAGQVSTERHGNLPVRPGTSPDGGSRPCAGPGGTVPVADRRGRSAPPRRAAARCHGRQCWCSRWPGPLPASRCGRRGALVPGSGALPRRSGPGAVSGRDARRSSRAVRDRLLGGRGGRWSAGSSTSRRSRRSPKSLSSRRCGGSWRAGPRSWSRIG